MYEPSPPSGQKISEEKMDDDVVCQCDMCSGAFSRRIFMMSFFAIFLLLSLFLYSTVESEY